MIRVLSSRLYEVEKVLEKIDSWSEEELRKLPKLYREKAREYRRLLQQGKE